MKGPGKCCIYKHLFFSEQTLPPHLPFAEIVSKYLKSIKWCTEAYSEPSQTSKMECFTK